MATDTKAMTKILGIVLIIVGVGLAYWGYQTSGSVGSQVTQALSGSDDEVMMFYIGGAISFAVGVYLFIKK